MKNKLFALLCIAMLSFIKDLQSFPWYKSLNDGKNLQNIEKNFNSIEEVKQFLQCLEIAAIEELMKRTPYLKDTNENDKINDHKALEEFKNKHNCDQLKEITSEYIQAFNTIDSINSIPQHKQTDEEKTKRYQALDYISRFVTKNNQKLKKFRMEFNVSKEDFDTLAHDTHREVYQHFENSKKNLEKN